MALLSDEQIKKLKEAKIKYPDVNEDCIGCSACVSISEEVFELDDEGLSKVQFCDNYDNKSVDDAIIACPVDAISWKE